MAERLSLWIFVAIAFSIALLAVGLSQVVQSTGMISVLVATTVWGAVAREMWGTKERG